MRIPRFRIRTMMIAVAVAAAFSAGAATIQRRSVRFQELSVLHQMEAAKSLLSDLEVYLLQTAPQGPRFLTLGERFDVRLMSSLEDVGEIPTRGEDLIVVADIKGVLHFRVFESDRDTAAVETTLENRASQIKDLRGQLHGLWPPHELMSSEKRQLKVALTSILCPTASERQEILDEMDRPRREAQPLIVFHRYHWDLAKKYARAARRPWLAVASDPPAPPEPSPECQNAFRARYPDLFTGTPVPPPIRTDLADEDDAAIPTIAL